MYTLEGITKLTPVKMDELIYADDIVIAAQIQKKNGRTEDMNKGDKENRARDKYQ